MIYLDCTKWPAKMIGDGVYVTVPVAAVGQIQEQRDNLLAALKDIASRHRHRGTLTLDVEEFIDIENLIAEIEASK